MAGCRSYKAEEAQDEQTPPQTGKETILVAEDNAEVRGFICDVLQQYGYTIIEAVDGEDAIDTFRQQRGIDLIIIDTVMPKKTGGKSTTQSTAQTLM